MGTIVVGVDGSEGAARALRWAVDEAARRDAAVTAVLAWDHLDQHHADPAVAFDPDYGEQTAREAAEAAVAAADVAGAGVEVIVQTSKDLPDRALADRSQEADLLVVGSRGRGGFAGLLLGSVSDRCLSRSACPVVVVPPSSDELAPDTGRIVVGVDPSSGSRAALRWALDEAALRGATVVAVHAWQVPFLGMEPIATAALEPETFEQAGSKVLDEAIDEVAPDPGLRPDVQRVLAAGAAAPSLLHAAETADLVVLGGRPPEGVARLTVGSTARQVIHHSPRPVVVVPDD